MILNRKPINYIYDSKKELIKNIKTRKFITDTYGNTITVSKKRTKQDVLKIRTKELGEFICTKDFAKNTTIPGTVNSLWDLQPGDSIVYECNLKFGTGTLPKRFYELIELHKQSYGVPHAKKEQIKNEFLNIVSKVKSLTEEETQVFVRELTQDWFTSCLCSYSPEVGRILQESAWRLGRYFTKSQNYCGFYTEKKKSKTCNIDPSLSKVYCQVQEVKKKVSCQSQDFISFKTSGSWASLNTYAGTFFIS